MVRFRGSCVALDFLNKSIFANNFMSCQSAVNPLEQNGKLPRALVFLKFSVYA